MVTKNKELLLGASYFDLSHCGYIETKDLEDILVPLQLDLSRAAKSPARRLQQRRYVGAGMQLRTCHPGAGAS